MTLSSCHSYRLMANFWKLAVREVDDGVVAGGLAIPADLLPVEARAGAELADADVVELRGARRRRRVVLRADDERARLLDVAPEPGEGDGGLEAEGPRELRRPLGRAADDGAGRRAALEGLVLVA